MWDTIVLGSGIGGLTAAAALARCGQRVLVLEQHSVAGGLTQTFQRHDWTFATGVHYVSGVAPRSPKNVDPRGVGWGIYPLMAPTPMDTGQSEEERHPEVDEIV